MGDLESPKANGIHQQFIQTYNLSHTEDDRKLALQAPQSEGWSRLWRERR